jgi:hypothetical protein
MARGATALLFFLAFPTLVIAQPSNRAPTATTLDALALYPGFYHLKVVVVRGRLIDQGDRIRLVPANGEGRGVELVAASGAPLPSAGSGEVEVRGQFWDVGRLFVEDPAVASGDLPALVRARVGDRWPAHGELLAIGVSAVQPAPPPSPAPSLRLIALDPARYDTQPVRVRGRFAGSNLLADLPQAPRVSRSDFVLASAGGAVWVSGLEPRGRGWRLDASSRLDTDQWLEVEGTVHAGHGLVWIQARSVSRAQADAVATSGADVPRATVLPPPPLEVVFSLPQPGETDVGPTVSIKFQVSRDLDPATFDRHIGVMYLDQPSGTSGPAFQATFDRGNRVLELHFAQPLERFRTVQVELREGIRGTDGQALTPYRLAFSTGDRSGGPGRLDETPEGRRLLCGQPRD